MCLIWNKCYIMLVSIAIVFGLVFKFFDLEKLFGGVEDLGIICVLILIITLGVEIGRRYFSLNVLFQNGSMCGKDVFVSIDYIIGGLKMVG